MHGVSIGVSLSGDDFIAQADDTASTEMRISSIENESLRDMRQVGGARNAKGVSGR